MSITTMTRTTLADTADALTRAGRGILAADESIRTMSSRLEAEGVEGTERNRRDYRELLVSAPGLGDLVSGVILSDETFGQDTAGGRPLREVCHEVGILPGIKVDTGTSPLPGGRGALVTEGLDGLGARLADYASRGAAFAKWRAVIDVAHPDAYAIEANAHALARYAALCQEHSIVPVVEPEVLAAGTHSLPRCAEVTKTTLRAVFAALEAAGVDLRGIVLKPGFVTPGLDAPQVSASAVAAVTYDVLRECVPADVTGIAFLSGGHPTDDVCGYLARINEVGQAPWHLTFSFGRALVSEALATWGGSPANVTAAQRVLLRCCRAAAEATTARAA